MTQLQNSKKEIIKLLFDSRLFGIIPNLIKKLVKSFNLTIPFANVPYNEYFKKEVKSDIPNFKTDIADIKIIQENLQKELNNKADIKELDKKASRIYLETQIQDVTRNISNSSRKTHKEFDSKLDILKAEMNGLNTYLISEIKTIEKDYLSSIDLQNINDKFDDVCDQCQLDQDCAILTDNKVNALEKTVQDLENMVQTQEKTIQELQKLIQDLYSPVVNSSKSPESMIKSYSDEPNDQDDPAHEETTELNTLIKSYYNLVKEQHIIDKNKWFIINKEGVDHLMLFQGQEIIKDYYIDIINLFFCGINGPLMFTSEDELCDYIKFQIECL